MPRSTVLPHRETQDAGRPAGERRRGARVRVVVADDHPLVRDGLMRALSDDGRFEVLEPAADGRRAVALAREHAPDLAVLDVRMPGLDGLRAMDAIHEQAPGTKVVLLSAFRDHELVRAARLGGAAAYLTKGTDRVELCEALAHVAAGEPVRAHAPDRTPRMRPDERAGRAPGGREPDHLGRVRSVLREHARSPHPAA